MDASGVRSSWLASATNWRTRVSLACLAVSALDTWSIIRFSAAPTFPASVRPSVSASGTRTSSPTSPRSSGSREIRAAVAATRSSGRSDSRIIAKDRKPEAIRPAMVTTTSVAISSLTIDSTLLSGTPTTSVWPWASTSERTR